MLLISLRRRLGRWGWGWGRWTEEVFPRLVVVVLFGWGGDGTGEVSGRGRSMKDGELLERAEPGGMQWLRVSPGA